MDRTPPPKFVKASRIEISRRCPECQLTTRHVYHHWEPDDDRPDGLLVYGCRQCGRPRRISWEIVGAEPRPVGEDFKIAFCPVDDAITLHQSHPAGWMCSKCKHCREAVQATLGEQPGRPA